MANDQQFRILCSKIDSYREELFEVSQTLWKNPELALEEFKAHSVLTEFLELHGFTVKRHAYDLETAFEATYNSPSYKSGPNVGVLCEYDALPGIGHGCGHNLIAEVGLGAALGIKEILSKAEYKLDAKLTVLGTPAEENKSGKVLMIKAGAFRNIDFAMMSHPAGANVSKPKLPSIAAIIVKYHGSPSHACTAPWAGVNALDAAVMAYQGLSLLRQQIRPDWRINVIITHGGLTTAIIPQYAELKINSRTMSKSESKVLQTKVEACLNAAAAATGCQVSIEIDGGDCMCAMLHNNALANVYERNCEKLQISITKDPTITGELVFSTDMGDVSNVVPSIHPVYGIGSKGPNHTLEFTEASGDAASQTPTLLQSKCLALTALDVIITPGLLTEVKEEFIAAVKQ